MQTGVAVIQQCHDFLEYLGVAKDIVGLVEATHEYRTSQMAQGTNSGGVWDNTGTALVKSILLDTGAQMNCVRQAAEKHFKSPKKSQMIAAGVGGKQVGRKDGKLTMMCLNTAKAKGRKPVQALEMKATSFKDFQDELLSFDPFYQEGLSLAIRQPEEGQSEIYDWQDPSWAIPTRYDWVGGGGWWVDYIYEDELHKADNYVQLLAKETEYRAAAASSEAVQMLRVNSFSVESAEDYLNKLLSTKQVRSLKRVRNSQVEPKEPEVTFLVQEENTTKSQLEEIMAGVGLKQTDQVTFEATHPGEVEIKGVKAGLHHGLNKQPYWAFHGNHGHCGAGKHTDGTTCPICIQVKGCATKYYKKYAPYKDVRMGHTWAMDMVTMETRSVEGNKYLVVLRDMASDDFGMVWLAHRGDAHRLIRRWILDMRADPDYQDLGYPIVQTIVTDNAGEWDMTCKRFQAVMQELVVKPIYTTPETSKELGFAEKNNHTMEVTILAILIQENLPKSHWEAASRSALFLRRRLPTVAKSRAASKDGDCVRPMEALSHGKHSRRQIDKELTYFCQAGKLAMVHCPKVKGSSLEPRVRWGVAWDHYRDQTIFRCPYTGHTFKSKSFTVIEMPASTNYIQFLRIEGSREQKAMAKKAMPILGDHTEKVDIFLPEPSTPGNRGLPKNPIVRLRTSNEEGVQYSPPGGVEEAKQIPPNSEGGEVHIFTHDGKEVLTAPNGVLVTKVPGASGTELLPSETGNYTTISIYTTMHSTQSSTSYRCRKRGITWEQCSEIA
jgi:hypothetical protein